MVRLCWVCDKKTRNWPAFHIARGNCCNWLDICDTSPLMFSTEWLVVSFAEMITIATEIFAKRGDSFVSSGGGHWATKDTNFSHTLCYHWQDQFVLQNLFNVHEYRLI